MEELLEFAAENAETLGKTGAGFTAGAAVTYLHRYRAEKHGVEPFPDDSNPVNEKILEEDPVYGAEAYTENRLMEAYYDRFDSVKNNYRDAKFSVLATAFLHGSDRFLLEEDRVSFEDYPEMAGGEHSQE